MPMNHVTIPNSILLRFKNQDGSVTFYDFKSKTIENLEIDRESLENDRVKYNVLKDWFTKDTEDYFHNYESLLGELYKKIYNFKNAVDNGKWMQLTIKRDLVIKVIAYQLIRQQETLEELYKNSMASNLVTIDFYKDKLYSTELLDSFVINVKRILQDFYITITLIDTSKCTNSFCLTDNLVQSVGNKIYIVLSPFVAITLDKAESSKFKKGKNEYLKYKSIDSDDYINNIMENTINYIIKDSKNKTLIGLKDQLLQIKN